MSRRNPTVTIPGMPDFTGPQLIAAAASGVLMQQSYVGASPVFAEVIRDRDDGTLDLDSLRAGYVPCGVTGLVVCGLMSIGTKSWLPFAAGLAAAWGMITSYELLLPSDVRLNAFQAIAVGVTKVRPHSSFGPHLALPTGGGGQLLPVSPAPAPSPYVPFR